MELFFHSENFYTFFWQIASLQPNEGVVTKVNLAAPLSAQYVKFVMVPKDRSLSISVSSIRVKGCEHATTTTVSGLKYFPSLRFYIFYIFLFHKIQFIIFRSAFFINRSV